MPAVIEMTLAPVSGRSANGSAMPAFDGNATASETLTVAGTPSTATAGPFDFGRFVNTGDQEAYIAIGATPDATQTPRWFLGVGQTLILSLSEGDKTAFTNK